MVRASISMVRVWVKVRISRDVISIGRLGPVRLVGPVGLGVRVSLSSVLFAN